MADVQNLRGINANHVNAQEHVTLAIEQEFEHSGVVADELTLGEF